MVRDLYLNQVVKYSKKSRQGGIQKRGRDKVQPQREGQTVPAYAILQVKWGSR